LAKYSAHSLFPERAAPVTRIIFSSTIEILANN
jgi:hypothetical protein